MGVVVATTSVLAVKIGIKLVVPHVIDNWYNRGTCGNRNIFGSYCR